MISGGNRDDHETGVIDSIFLNLLYHKNGQLMKIFLIELDLSG